MKEEFRERLPIAEWPELDRKIAIISRMTSDPQPKSHQKLTKEKESIETVS
ncbi:MAG: hypothetical protein ACFFE2_15975 [Candidatus Thorarchaeota archaeon]